MTASQPPRLATTLLILLGPESAGLRGDLLEEFRRRDSRVWYWRQVIAAVFTGVIREGQIHPIALFAGITMGWMVAWVIETYIAHTAIDAGLRWYLTRYYAHGGHGLPPLRFIPALGWLVPAVANTLGGSMAVRYYRGHRALMAMIYAATVWCRGILLVASASIYYDAIATPPRYGIDLPFGVLPLLNIFGVIPVAALVGGLWAAHARRSSDLAVVPE